VFWIVVQNKLLISFHILKTGYLNMDRIGKVFRAQDKGRKNYFLYSGDRASLYNSNEKLTWRTISSIYIYIYLFISILYMFRTTLCSSSGESIVSIQLLVYVTLCRWPSGMQVGKFLPDLHTGRSPTQSDIYQMLYWYNWLSWWWAQGCSKHVQNRNK
jgi:hypothetical protein